MQVPVADQETEAVRERGEGRGSSLQIRVQEQASMSQANERSCEAYWNLVSTVEQRMHSERGSESRTCLEQQCAASFSRRISENSTPLQAHSFPAQYASAYSSHSTASSADPSSEHPVLKVHHDDVRNAGS